jgi:hypothetical protein
MGWKTYEIGDGRLSSACYFFTPESKGKERREKVVFSGGRISYSVKARYSTDDHDLQKAIEESKWFNRDFILVPDTNSEAPQDDDDSDYEIVSGVKTFAEAKEYILTKTYPDGRKVTQVEIHNESRLRNVAEKLKIKFPDWED